MRCLPSVILPLYSMSPLPSSNPGPAFLARFLSSQTMTSNSSSFLKLKGSPMRSSFFRGSGCCDASGILVSPRIRPLGRSLRASSGKGGLNVTLLAVRAMFGARTSMCAICCSWSVP
ncbi:hypothetical protein ABW21_db0208637 [Orbilia brochopaga]|nr:hypothetical protein ABW21_db0208637 [Drechslerella brochopaga]